MADVTLDEVWRLFKETEQQFKATDDRLQRLSDDLRLLAEENRRRDEMSARERAETAEIVRSNVRAMRASVAKLSDRIGDFAVEMVLPAARTIFQSRGIPVHAASRWHERQKDGRHIEIDILVANEEHLMAIEVKSRLSAPDVAEHLARLAAFKDFFPEYRDRKLFGAVAGMVVDEDAGRPAYRQGLFVLGQSGETVRILNADGFIPKVW